MAKVFLGPYIITSSLKKTGDYTYIDETKTKLTVKIYPLSKIDNFPSEDAVLLKEISNSTHTIRWFELKNTYGRIFTILPTPCEIYISNFESGFNFQHDLDSKLFGSQTFPYEESGISHCVFDESIFDVLSHISDSEFFNCNNFETMEAIPNSPSEVTQVSAENDPVIIQAESNRNNSWNINFENKFNDFGCTNEELISQTDGCNSKSNPKIAILSSGHAAIVYEDRDKSGKTKISLSISKTTVPYKIYYYRENSSARIIQSLTQSSEISTEVYDDIYFDTTNNIPNETLYMSFLNGPLKSRTEKILRIERTEFNNSYKNKIYIQNSSGIKFEDSNDVNAKYFIITTKDEFPSKEDINQIIDIPYHTNSKGEIIPVANPSICTFNNNLALDQSQYINIVYQGFDNEQWNIYLKQIRLSDYQKELPTYQSPYNVFVNSYNVASVGDLSGKTLTYKVISEAFRPYQYARLQVFMDNGEQVIICNTQQPLEVIVYSSSSFCYLNIFVGDEFTGVYPPQMSMFDGRVSPSIACASVAPYLFGDTDFFCINSNDCNQIYVYDDPYCFSPYDSSFTFRYYPQDMWTINNNEEKTTRVLYSMSATDESLSDEIDFMIVLNYRNSMSNIVKKIRDFLYILFENCSKSNTDLKVGITLFARGDSSLKQPSNYIQCSTPNSGKVFDGFQAVSGLTPVDGGFTSVLTVLQSYLDYWDVSGDDFNSSGTDKVYPTPWMAVDYAISNPDFSWRTNSNKYVFLVTDGSDSYNSNTSCSGYENEESPVVTKLINNEIKLICSTCIGGCGNLFGGGEDYSGTPTLTGWTEDDLYNITSNYIEIFNSISAGILSKVTGARIFERDTYGTSKTYLNDAHILVSYKDDLSSLWNYKKSNFIFKDNHPVLLGASKGLTNLPYPLKNEIVFGIDPIQLLGQTSNWVYFKNNGNLNYDYPSIGFLESSQNSYVLLAENATRPIVVASNKNDLYVVFENHDFTLPQISIIGTNDFGFNSKIGVKTKRITRFLDESDFIFINEITTNGINQLPDIRIDKNDNCHVVWQSNISGEWEIYYANGHDSFRPEAITDKLGKSSYPKIDITENGKKTISFNDNRTNNNEIFLAYSNKERSLNIIEQDPYSIGYYNGYTHYIDQLPMSITNTSGESGYFNIIINFYDNFNCLGDPSVVIDSINSQDAFINQDNEYDEYVFSTNGIFLEEGQTSLLIFNSFIIKFNGDYVYPFSFTENKVYIPKVKITRSNKKFDCENQMATFSCSKSNTEKSLQESTCGYSFSLPQGSYNLKIKFFGDSSYLNSTKELNFIEDNLNFKINNNPSSDFIVGSLIVLEKSSLIQLYPENELECGINYFVKIYNNDIEIDDKEGIYKCECQQSTNEKWVSSVNGHSDSQLTNTDRLNYRPISKSETNQESNRTIILFNSFDKKNKNPEIMGCIYENEQFSGSGVTIDATFGINGNSLDFSLDQYNNLNVVYEKQQISNGLPVSSLYFKKCGLLNIQQAITEDCKVLQTENVLTDNPYVLGSIVKQARINKEFVDYYTYDNNNNLVPVVKNCYVEITIIGTQELVAYRIRNENETHFTEWCSISPEVSDYTAIIKWTLSANSGSKKVCFQTMNYNGVTPEFCIPVIADYKQTNFDIKLYTDDTFSKEYELFNSFYVVSTNNNGTKKNEKDIFIEILLTDPINTNSVSFDVLFQGSNDIFDQIALKTIRPDGIEVFRGKFTIKTEDNLINKDGFATVKIKYNSECFSLENSSNYSSFIKDNLNVFGSSSNQETDQFESERQISGNIGTDIIIRPDEDPYLIFGNYKYINE